MTLAELEKLEKRLSKSPNDAKTQLEIGGSWPPNLMIWLVCVRARAAISAPRHLVTGHALSGEHAILSRRISIYSWCWIQFALTLARCPVAVTMLRTEKIRRPDLLIKCGPNLIEKHRGKVMHARSPTMI